MDSDDWASKEMFEILFNKAELGHDIVVCNLVRAYFPNDLQARTIKAYGGITPICLEEFIKRAYNSASPCNKLFSHTLINNAQLQYPKIPYEDVSFVPALMTYASNIAYVDNDLYYYRITENSVTYSQMYDDKILYKIEAYKDALKKSNPDRKDLLLYSLVNKLVEDISAFPNYDWYFKQYLKDLQEDIKTNVYLQAFYQNPKFITLLNEQQIPTCIHIFCIGRLKPTKLLDELRSFFGEFSFKIWDENNFNVNEIDVLKKAYDNGMIDFVNDYAKIEVLYNEGGIAVDPSMSLTKHLASHLKHKIILGSQGPDQIHTHIMASYPKQDFFLNLITTYQFCPYMNEFLPLSLRIRDCLYALAQQKISGYYQRISH